MAKTSPLETTFSKFTAVQSQLAELAATEAKNAADTAAQAARLTAERQALNLTLAPLSVWRNRLELLATQRAFVLQKRDYAVVRHAAFEVDLRAFARANHHQDNWFSSPLDNHLTAQHSERMIGFLNRELADIDLDVAGITGELAAFEKLHGVS